MGRAGSEQFDRTFDTGGAELLGEAGFRLHDVIGPGRAQQPPLRATVDGKEADAPGLGAAHVPTDGGNALVGEIGHHEFDVVVADRTVEAVYGPAAEHLGPEAVAPAGTAEHAVDELLHGGAAVAGRSAEPVVGGVGEQEMVHAADTRLGVEQAGGNARAEGGGDDHIWFRTDHAVADDDADHPRPDTGIDVAAGGLVALLKALAEWPVHSASGGRIHQDRPFTSHQRPYQTPRRGKRRLRHSRGDKRSAAAMPSAPRRNGAG